MPWRAPRKAANPNTLYLFDGDMLSPSLLSGLDKGANMIELTNLVPFDLAVPGNHEYDFGPEVFAEAIKKSKYPWAAINITQADGTRCAGPWRGDDEGHRRCEAGPHPRGAGHLTCCFING